MSSNKNLYSRKGTQVHTQHDHFLRIKNTVLLIIFYKCLSRPSPLSKECLSSLPLSPFVQCVHLFPLCWVQTAEQPPPPPLPPPPFPPSSLLPSFNPPPPNTAPAQRRHQADGKKTGRRKRRKSRQQTAILAAKAKSRWRPPSSPPCPSSPSPTSTSSPTTTS